MCQAHQAMRRRHRPAGRQSHAKPPPPVSFLSRPIRIGLYLALAGIVVLAVGLLLWPRNGNMGPTDQTLQVTMGGFSATVVTARAGQPLRLRLVNPDSAFHSDGGGWHQLAIPALGVDARVAPRSEQVIEIPATPPGEYAFYCDICCGGKENPSMQGRLRVLA